MTTNWLLRKDSSMPYQIWNEFQPEEPVEVMNAYGDVRTGFAKEFWWGHETELGEISEGTITKARRLTMMTEHEAIPGTEYYGDDHYEDQVEDMKEIAQYTEFDEYQDFTDTTAIYPEDNAQEYLMYGLVSEVGELAGKMKKELRDGTVFSRDDFIKELGDVLWYVGQLASCNGIFLSDVARVNVEKLKSRKERNTIGGSGDER